MPYGTSSSWKRHDHVRCSSFNTAIAASLVCLPGKPTTIPKIVQAWGVSHGTVSNMRKRLEAMKKAGKSTTGAWWRDRQDDLPEMKDQPVTVFSDANIVANGMNGWLQGWKAKGWMTSSRKPVQNRDLWERLDAAAEGRKVTFAWLRGHNGNPLNEAADSLAYREARAAEAALVRERGY